MEEGYQVRTMRMHNSTESDDPTSFNENSHASSVNKKTMQQLSNFEPFSKQPSDVFSSQQPGQKFASHKQTKAPKNSKGHRKDQHSIHSQSSNVNYFFFSLLERYRLQWQRQKGNLKFQYIG